MGVAAGSALFTQQELNALSTSNAADRSILVKSTAGGGGGESENCRTLQQVFERALGPAMQSRGKDPSKVSELIAKYKQKGVQGPIMLAKQIANKYGPELARMAQALSLIHI